jgi:hypothetical protein
MTPKRDDRQEPCEAAPCCSRATTNERKNTILNAPLIRYELVKAEQRARWQEAARARKARAATHDQAGRVEPVEAASDLTGLVERVIQNVWKRLGLPAREGVPAAPGAFGRSASAARVSVWPIIPGAAEIRVKAARKFSDK